ncbi:hypothetical protein C2S51_038534 [Perilla frutescens var. frutescens]|nr:hypothetical protein C2S51_038534 [Perilla frutescens var. frutescens]
MLVRRDNISLLESIHCPESIGALFPTPLNPIDSRRDPDQKLGKHKRAHETRSSYSSSGDYDRRISSLVGKIKEALIVEIINYLKHDLIGDVKNALLPNLKEFIQTFKCDSRQSAAHHSHCHRSPIQDHDSAEGHQSHHPQLSIRPSPDPARASSSIHDESSHHSHHPEIARRSLHIDVSRTKPRQRNHRENLEKMPVMEKLRMFVAQEPVVAASCLIAGVGLFLPAVVRPILDSYGTSKQDVPKTSMSDIAAGIFDKKRV